MSRHSTDSDAGSAPDDGTIPGNTDGSVFRRVVEHHPEGVLTVDAAGEIAYANRAFARLLGYDPDDLPGRPVVDVLAGADGAVPAVFADGDGPETTEVGEPEGTDGTNRTDGRATSDADEHPISGHHADGHDRALSLTVVDREEDTTTAVVRDRENDDHGDGDHEGGDREDAADARHGDAAGPHDPQGPTDTHDPHGPTGIHGCSDTHDSADTPARDVRTAVDSSDDAAPAARERERDLRAYEAVVESMADGVIVLAPDRTIRIANETFARPLGYAPEDLLGRRIDALVEDGVLAEGTYERLTDHVEAVFGGDAEQRRFETRLRTVSGERRFEAVLTRLPTGERDVVGVIRDVTAQHERDQRLGALHEATRDLMVADSTRAVAEEVVEAARAILDIPIAAVRLHTPDDRLELAAWTEPTEARLGLDRTYAVGEGPAGRAFETGETVVYDDLRDVDDEYDRAGIESGAYLPLGEYGVVSLGALEAGGFDEPDLQLATLLATNAAVAIERAERRRILEALHDTTRRLMQAESPEEVATLAIETARDVLDFPLTGVWLYDEKAEALKPAAQPPEADELVGGAPTYTAGNSLSWQAFATGEVQVHEDTTTTEGTYSETPTMRSEIIVPLGDHGVLNVGSTTVGEFEDADVYFVRVLAANTEAALDRAARERELAAQRDELATLARINALIHEIIQGLTDAATREEIERIVCERFAGSERYRFAWIGEHDAATERLVARTGTDRAEEYLGTVEIGTDEASEMGWGPGGQAIRTGELAVCADVFEDPAFEPWREQAREFGYRSVAAIPLRHERVTYGLLAVYAVEADAFGEREREALSVLGETVGFALNAARNIQLLRGNSVTELEFRASGATTLAGVLSTRLGCTTRLDSIVPSDEGTLQYLTVEGAPTGAIRDVLADAAALDCGAAVTDWRVIDADDGGDGDGCRLELAASDSAPGVLLAAGATVRTVVADGETVRIVAEAPPDADVRAVVDRLRETHPGIELRAKRETDRPVRTADEVRDRVDEAFTDRQRTALEAAYAAGYYDWPRESTAEEVADSMGIASPTLHSHLRKAQRKLLDVLLDEHS